MATYQQNKRTGAWRVMNADSGQWEPSSGPPPELTGPPPSQIEESMGALNPPPPSLGQRALSAGGAVLNKGLEVLDWPHQNISKPIAKAVASVIPEGTLQMTPFVDSGEVGREPIDFSPKQFVEQGVPYALDFPVYGAAGKVAKLLGKGIKAGVKGGVGTAQKLGGYKTPPPLNEGWATKPRTADTLDLPPNMRLKEPGAAPPANLSVPPKMRERMSAPPEAVAEETAEFIPQSTKVGDEVTSALDAITAEFTAQKSPPVSVAAGPVNEPARGLRIPEVPGPPKPPWVVETSPAMARIRELTKAGGRAAYEDKMAAQAGRTGFAPPSAKQPIPFATPERIGTEMAQAKRKMQSYQHNKLQNQMQEIDRLKQLLGVQ